MLTAPPAANHTIRVSAEQLRHAHQQIISPATLLCKALLLNKSVSVIAHWPCRRQVRSEWTNKEVSGRGTTLYLPADCCRAVPRCTPWQGKRQGQRQKTPNRLSARNLRGAESAARRRLAVQPVTLCGPPPLSSSRPLHLVALCYSASSLAQ